MAKKQKPVGVLVEELRDLVTDYVKQETVEPAKYLGKTFLASVGGGVVLGTGISLMLVGVLRFFQAIVFDTTNSASWRSLLPYLCTLGVAALVIGVVAMMMKGLTSGSSTD